MHKRGYDKEAVTSSSSPMVLQTPGSPPPDGLKREVSFLTRVLFENIKKNSAAFSSVCALLFFDTTPPIENVRKIVQENFLPYDKRFSSTLTEVNGNVIWQPVTVDLKRHVVQRALPGIGDKSTLEAFLSDLYSEPMDPQYPLWYLYVLTNWEGSPSKCVMISQNSHELGDGISLAVFWDSIFRTQDPNIKDTPYGKTGLHKVKRSLNLFDISESILMFLLGIGHALFAPLISVDTPTILKLSDHRRLAARKEVAFSNVFPLQTFLDIKELVGGTVNDVFVASLAGGIRRYLLNHDSHFKVQKKAQLHGVFPLTTRRRNQTQLGNRFLFCSLPFPVSLEDPLDRLRASKKRSDFLKQSPEAPIFMVMQRLGEMFLPSSLMLAMQGIMLDKFTLVFSNVPGPASSRVFAGLNVTNMTGCVNSPLASCISLTTYNSSAMFSIVSDSNVLPKPGKLLAYVEEELLELHKLSKEKGHLAKKHNSPPNTSQLFYFFFLLSILLMIFQFVRYLRSS